MLNISNKVLHMLSELDPEVRNKIWLAMLNHALGNEMPIFSNKTEFMLLKTILIVNELDGEALKNAEIHCDIPQADNTQQNNTNTITMIDNCVPKRTKHLRQYSDEYREQQRAYGRLGGRPRKVQNNEKGFAEQKGFLDAKKGSTPQDLPQEYQVQVQLVQLSKNIYKVPGPVPGKKKGLREKERAEKNKPYTFLPKNQNTDFDSYINKKKCNFDYNINKKNCQAKYSEIQKKFIKWWNANIGFFHKKSFFISPNYIKLWNDFWAEHQINEDWLEEHCQDYVKACKLGLIPEKYYQGNPIMFLCNGHFERGTEFLQGAGKKDKFLTKTEREALEQAKHAAQEQQEKLKQAKKPQVCPICESKHVHNDENQGNCQDCKSTWNWDKWELKYTVHDAISTQKFIKMLAALKHS